MPSKRLLTVAAALAAGFSSFSHANNLLTNAGFNNPSGDAESVTLTGYSLVGESAAKDWYVFHNTPGTTFTMIVPSETSPDGRMLYVKTDGTNNGIEQIMGAFDTGPACVKHGAWIYLESGSILIGAGNGGATGADVVFSEVGTWKFVSATNTFCPANLFIVYSASPEGASFYVDDAAVEAEACQGPPGDLNMDGAVNGSDLADLLGQWGYCPGCNADLTNEDVVNGADLAILLANWGC